MYRLTIEMHKRLMRGETPVSYIVIETHMGYRAYAEKELVGVFDVEGLIADGSIIADGSELAGSDSAGVIEKSGRVIEYMPVTRELQSLKDTVMGSYLSRKLHSFSVELDNSDGVMSRMIATEPWIGRPLTYYAGFEDLPQHQHLRMFSGVVTEMEIGNVMTVEATEQ